MGSEMNVSVTEGETDNAAELWRQPLAPNAADPGTKMTLPGCARSEPRFVATLRPFRTRPRQGESRPVAQFRNVRCRGNW